MGTTGHSNGAAGGGWHPAWVGAVGALLYLPTLQYALTRYDDPWLIRDNALLQGFSPSRLSTVLFDTSVEARLALGAEYLPTRDLSVMLDFAVWGDWFGGHHLTQVLLYAALCSLAASLCLELFGSRRLAWWFGAAYAVHPVHVEAVAWLSERKGVLGATLFFAAAWLGVRFLKRGAPWRLVGSLSLVALATWSKGHMVVGAAAIALCALWSVNTPRTRRMTLGVGALIVGTLAFVPVYLAGQSVGMVQPYHGGGLLETAMLFTVVHGKYLLLMMLAGPYAIAYPIDPDLASPADPWLAILGGAALLIFGFFAVRAAFRPAHRSATALGLGWWLVFLAPVSHVVFPLQNLLADRYLLVGSWGLLLALAVGLVRLPMKSMRLVGACWLIASVAWTSIQIAHWESSERLRLHAVSVHPGHVESWHRLASHAQELGDYDRALRYLDLAVARADDAPDRWRLDHRRALIHRDQGKSDEAIRWMRLAASTPQAHKAYANLGYMLAAEGATDEALESVRKAVEFEARSAHNQRALGVVALKAGREDEACEAFARAVRLEPFNADNHFNVGLCAARRGDRALRDAAFDRAVELDPSIAAEVAEVRQASEP
ncbi:MAG: tetratricopeptide repeat protein [Myxococcota bacterium]